MKILVIAAHPDDEVLGMGGTIAKFTKSGHDVKILIMATGISARRSDNYKNESKYESTPVLNQEMLKQIKLLKNDAIKAAKILGSDNVDFFDFPDNEMDTVSNLKITKSIENSIKEFKPNSIYTHSNIDINIDHRILYNSVLTATRPNFSNSVCEVITFEVPSSSEWNFPNVFSPNIFVDITKELKIKLKAMKAYKNEIRSFPHPRSLESLESYAKRWGTVSGYKAAEAFSLVRKLI
ncbi:MAG: PIG-L family deacetylase [Nitrosopumilus sp.]|uniref:PIG-L deacetylase family protein n=1 Tax=Nitrosopumilus sp. TaxID=2024843 RepID=UPI00247BF928|nr:PIG-L family deacetylase [Nitrosopumilus sp.]MCV0393550.1 PIG-L family deacetylase [Nitrosopumilus sp.]